MRSRVQGFARPTLVLALATVVALGCRAPKIRERPLHRAGLLDRFSRRTESSLPSTYVIGGDRSASYEYLRMRVEGDGRDQPADLLEVAELAEAIGVETQRRDPVGALVWHRDAAAYAAFCLAASAPDNAPESAALRGRALDLHNRSVHRLLRCAGAREGGGSDWRAGLAAVQVVPVNSTARRRNLEWDELWLVDDYKVKNLEPLLRRDGLGVPVVALKEYPDRRAVPDRFYPARTRLAATAVLAPQGELAGGAWRSVPVRLDLHDPLQQDSTAVGPAAYPLAYDLTTPLAHQVLRSNLEQMATTGLLNPEKLIDSTGVYFSEPYERGKVPVLFIHGLNASPKSWMPMINAIHANPDINQHYQIMFAFYATGEPLLYTVSLLRDSLERARDAFDPDHSDAAWDRMIVVGHSLGAVTARTLVISSGEAVESAIFRIPSERVAMSDQTRALFNRATHFEPHPPIRRAVFIAGPFRGSWIANRGLGRFTTRLIRRPRNITEAYMEIRAANGVEVLQPFYQRRIASSVDNLEFDSPILLALDSVPIEPGLPYHVIAGNIRPNAPNQRWGDLIVPYASAHLDGAETELIVRRTHFCTGAPEVIHETLRILRLHEGLGEAPAGPEFQSSTLAAPAVERVEHSDAIVIEASAEVEQAAPPRRWKAVR